jgi:hypothetical protein
MNDGKNIHSLEPSPSNIDIFGHFVPPFSRHILSRLIPHRVGKEQVFEMPMYDR